MEHAWDINKRQGLPSEMQLLSRLYPRHTWRGHGNFSDLTAFWLDRHLMFRDLVGRLQALSRTALDTGGLKSRELARFSGFFLEQLQHHHQVEDQHYFPQLVKLDARLAHGFDLLEADHASLDGLLHRLATATNAVLQARSADHADVKGADQALVGAMLSLQDEAADFLDRHLADEEDLVVPLILEYAPDMD